MKKKTLIIPFTLLTSVGGEFCQRKFDKSLASQLVKQSEDFWPLIMRLEGGQKRTICGSAALVVVCHTFIVFTFLKGRKKCNFLIKLCGGF